MPIDYKEYHPKWKLIRRLILKRANHKCERCGLPNYSIGIRSSNGKFSTDLYLTKTGADRKSLRSINKRLISFYTQGRYIKIILTIAHIDRNKDNNDFDNLEALCQRCHLNHDQWQHVNSRKYGKKYNRSHQLKIF